jgi:hypothetical protein
MISDSAPTVADAGVSNASKAGIPAWKSANSALLRPAVAFLWAGELREFSGVAV